MGAEIDYGLGLSNIDHATGIRYGVISRHSVGEAWDEGAEPDYGDPHCPKCGDEASTGTEREYRCRPCKYHFDSDEAFVEEALGYSYDQDGYKLSSCLDSDIMVIASPYYTLAPFCSPCVPGAGDLDSAREDGVRTYALGHDWYDGGVAPYPVYRVSDGRQIIATRETVACRYCDGNGKRTVATLATARNQTMAEVKADIATGKIPLQGYDATAETFHCFVCDGKGTREEVVEREA